MNAARTPTPALIAALLIGGLVGASGCEEDVPVPTPSSGASASVASAPEPPPTPSASPAAASAIAGDAARGAELVKQHECNRCHEGTGLEPASFETHCFRCHEEIITDKFKIADTEKLAKWKRNVRHVQFAPSLEGSARRFERAWLTAFLREPTDLRPHLVASMPRLGLTDQEAADIAAHLTKDAEAAPLSLDDASSERGRKVIEQRACGTCHVMTGAPPLPSLPETAPDKIVKAVELAPDLRHARERLSAAAIVAWLRDPASIKPGTVMPNLGLSEAEAKDAAKYLLTAPLDPAVPYEVPSRLPVLERKVAYAEVHEKVLGKICAHCHGNPDVAKGDGGPGNTGGFGFAPIKLDLSKYSGVASGYVGADGERHSVFLPLADGTPRIVAALLARHEEQAGKPREDVRGMPLGMPALPMEDIQLVESWVAQGRPK